jgi:Bacterial Ig-like domain (group 1)
MRTFKLIAVVSMLAVALAGCGGGGEESKFSDPGTQPPPPGGGTPTPAVASLNVIASTPTLASNGATPVDISVFARDANNAFVSGQTLALSASSGGLQVTQATTDTNGLAKAVLTTAGDPTNRTITVTAASGAITGTVTVNVSGSQLSVQGPNAMVMGQSGTYTVRLIDSGSTGIANRTVTLSSARSNTLSATSVTTDSSGAATFTMTIANTGSDTITATGMGITTTFAVAVNSDAFSFQTPAANTEVALGANQTVTVRWLQGGSPVVGQNITFASTRGTVSAPSVATDATGSASIQISAMNSGAAVVTATGNGGATAQLPVEFVATTPASIEAQPSVFTMAPAEQSTITAVVRDAAGNLVKNRTVTFSLQDVTGGSLSTASAVTDSQGRAQSTYTAGSTTSATGGVAITATVQGTAISDVINLTVAQRQLFISIGTGNELEVPNIVQYALPYVVQVTDANGNGVPNVPLSLSVLSVQYAKGSWNSGLGFALPYDPGSDQTINGTCNDEDVNHNGVLDAGEDFNTSTRIEAGNIATVTPANASTDEDGFAQIKIFYPQEYAYWLVVRLDVRAGVTGTEFIRSATILLPGTTDDFDGPGTPPGFVSPFGTQACNFAN